MRRLLFCLFCLLLGTLPVQATEIFNNGFEGCTDGSACSTGTGWDTETDTGGDMAASESVFRTGACSCTWLINDTTDSYVEEDAAITTETEATIRLFMLVADGGNYIDASGWAGLMRGRNEANDAGTFAWRFTQGTSAPTWAVSAFVNLDSGDTSSSDAFVIQANVWNCLQMHWKASSAAGANDGFMHIWVNSKYAGGVTGLDNDTKDFGELLVGDEFGQDAGTPSIRYYIDDVVIQDDSTLTPCSGGRNYPAPVSTLLGTQY